jgi:hypothetical protein
MLELEHLLQIVVVVKDMKFPRINHQKMFSLMMAIMECSRYCCRIFPDGMFTCRKVYISHTVQS